MSIHSNRLYEMADRKEASKIERKQRLEEERKKKIFNTKNRIFGIDKEALDEQIKEKKEMEQEEKKKDALFTKQMMEMIEAANELENKLAKDKKVQEMELLRYRELFQKKKDAREFDLNDPDFMKKGTIVANECNTLSSILTGKTYKDEKEEKLSRLEKREEQKSWLEQQIQEKREIEYQREEARKAYEVSLLTREKRAQELSYLEQEFKRRIAEATLEYNLCLANEIANQKRLNKIREEEDEKAEIYNAITGDFLTENPDLTFSSIYGPRKLVVTHFKGMTPKMRQDILETQKQQLKELQEKRRLEEETNKKWDDLMLEISRLANREDRNLMKKKLDLARQWREENECLAEKQRTNRKVLNQLFTNEASDEFFDQFGTSSR